MDHESRETPDDIPAVLPAELAAPVLDFRAVPWLPLDVVIGVALPALLMIAMTLERHWLEMVPSWLRMLLGAGSYLWFGLYPVWQARRRCPTAVWPWPSKADAVKECVIAMLLLAPWFLMLALVVSVFPRSAEERDLHTLSEQVGPHPVLIGLLFAAFTIAPLFEELGCRGLLQNALRRYLHLGLALLIQATVFGLLHPYSMSYMIATGFMGLFLGIVYEWRKTLLTPMFLHGWHNFLMALAAFSVMAQTAQAPVLGLRGVDDPHGCRVTEVTPGLGAEQAGLRPGDIIVRCAEDDIASFQDLRRAVRPRQAGDRVRVVYLRDGERFEVEVELRQRPARE